MSGRVRAAVLVVVLVAAVALPFVVSNFRVFQFTQVAVYAIALLGLNMLTGYNGQISLGHGAFMAIGAYTTAILHQHGVDLYLTIPIAAVLTGVVGFAFGFPALRLSGVYLALATFGLAMRAAAQNPVSSRLCGIRVGWMLAIGWGLAAMVGAVAGMMVAPIVFLDPNMMAGILIYAFASATLGGFTSPGGAVVGGLIVGVTENLVGTYVRFIGTELKLTVALLIIVVVLLVRPSGLFGHAVVRRV